MTIVTHSGKFHADEVFAVATLQLHLGENIGIVRTRDRSVIEKGDIVVDVGREYDPSRKRFDHHQLSAPARPDGKPYSSFGMVWKECGKAVCGSEEVARRIDERLAIPIDLADNGALLATPRYDQVTPVTLNHIVASYRPTWRDNPTGDTEFREALEFAKGLLCRYIRQIVAEVEGEKIVETAYTASPDKRIIELENRCLPWELVLNRYEEPLYMIAPRDEADAWSVATVPIVPHEMASRKPLPESWAGKTGTELMEATGISDASFCHKDRYIIVTASRESAYLLAQKALGA